MATYYVGKGGNDGNNGTTWALRKLTLNGAEDLPVAAGDTVYVGPGAYRELLTVDVSGGAGTEIVYIGDVTGEHTDDVGGIVRITGSDNDTTTARNNCITASSKDYRVFRGFTFDTSAQYLIIATDCTDWTVEDCSFQNLWTSLRVAGDSQADFTIRRCMFLFCSVGGYCLQFTSSGIQDAGHLIENCLIPVIAGRSVEIDDVGGITVRNCSITGNRGIFITDSPPVGYTAVTVNNSLICGCSTGLSAQVLGELVENYNTFYGNSTSRTNVNVGTNSVTYPPLWLPPILFSGASQASGYIFPWWHGELSEWSQLAHITGSAPPAVDLRGSVRPTDITKRSWGPFQFMDAERETGTVHAGSASLALHEPGRQRIFVPTSAVQTTVTSWVYREAGYAGGNPQMILKQPGQADRVTTDAAAAAQWNQLSDTFTPATDPPYVVVELVSRHGSTTSTSTSTTSTSTTLSGTSTSTSTTSTSTTTTTLAYDVYFDDLVVS